MLELGTSLFMVCVSMFCISYVLMYCKICVDMRNLWVKDAYSTAEATDNSAKEKNAESGRKSFF